MSVRRQTVGREGAHKHSVLGLGPGVVQVPLSRLDVLEGDVFRAWG